MRHVNFREGTSVSKKSFQLSNEKNSSCLGHVGVTQLYNKPIQGSLSNDQDSMESKARFFLWFNSQKDHFTELLTIQKLGVAGETFHQHWKPMPWTPGLGPSLVLCVELGADEREGFWEALWTLEDASNLLWYNNFNFIVKCVNNLGGRL